MGNPKSAQSKAPKVHPRKATPAPKVCCGTARDIPLSEPDSEELAAVFAALADPVRLRLLSLLSSSPNGEVCACDLVTPVGKSQPTVSHHLKVLHDAGLVSREKRGVWVWYKVETAKLKQLSETLQ
ncbi:MAG: metalloregulator ArsR/SmtB family transcription factor [Acidimicrobiales bacterium]